MANNLEMMTIHYSWSNIEQESSCQVCIGYWINENFITLKKLANDLTKPITINFENTWRTLQILCK